MKTKLIITILASLYFLYCATDVAQWHFIDNVNLLVHEGGHIVFMPFGQFMYVFGGSLMQVLLPALFVIYFYWRKEFYSASLVLFWVGENLINVSNYAADALKMQLPLLFGDDSIHDWNWLLFETHQLRHTNGIALTLRRIGILIIIISSGWSIYEATKNNNLKPPI
jgi:hypothetical protein